MAENVFEAVKQSVSTREAAAFYGIEVKRNGMACCPFHDDKNPSMKVDQRFHCFGCGADGDVIDFTAKLFNLSPKEATEKLAQDFGLIYDSQAPPRRRYVRQKTEAQKFREDRQRCYRVLSDYYYLLKKWEADRSPRTPEEEPHPRFVEAIQKKAYVEYLLDLFLYESEEEQKAWIAEHTAEITHLERRLKIMAENKPTNRERLREITDGIEQGIKELFESEKYMRYLSVMSRFHRYSVNNTMLIYIVDGSFLEEYDEYNIGVQFKAAATVSITYALMSRCGLEPERYFDHEDFMAIFDFNTPSTIGALGTAVSQINQQVLRQIGVTVRNAEREANQERSKQDEQSHDLYPERRLSDSRPEAEPAAGETPGQVRQDEENLPEGTPSHPLQPDVAEREAVPAPSGDRRDRPEQTGADDAPAGEGSGSHRGTESQRSHEVGGADEHLQSSGRGDPDGGAYQQLTLNLFLSEAEQIQSIDEAENVAHTSSAFSFAQNDIDHVLRLGGNTDRQRERVVAAFEKQKTTAEIAEILKTLYHGGNGLGSVSAWYAEDGIHLSHGKSVRYDRSAQVISWESAAERIGELLESGQFASNVELAEAAGYERSLLAEKLWYLYHDLSEGAREAGYLSCLSEIKGNGFPEETRRLTEQLSDPAFRQTLKEEYAAFWTAYQQDRDLLRFHYHRPREIWENLKDLDLPRRTFFSDLSQVPTVQHFITEDEIDVAMTGGSSFAGGKGRIYAFFMANHTDKEKVRFLKDEYGIGGRSHALSGATHSGEDHDGKGLHYKKQDCPDVHLNWEKVAKRITSLVQKDRYLTEQEQAQYDKIQSEKEQAEEDAIQAQQPEMEEETPKPILREQFEQYKPVVTAAISEDAAYRNACGHSDRENAVIEGNAAVRRAVLGSKDMELIRLYSDVPEFRQRLHREVIDETYPKLHELLRPLSQEDIDTALCAWNGNIESKHAVVRYMKDHAREKDTAAWLAQEYGGSNSNSLFVVRAGSPEETQLPWPKVQRRIAQLIQEDRFYTEEEQNRFDDIDPIAIREALEERGIVNGQVADPEKLDNAPFIQQVMSDAEQIADAETEQTSEVSISDEEYDAVRRPTLQRTSYDPAAPVYAVGDTVYIEDDAYQITELREDTVQLLPTGMVYPIYRAERKEQFEQLLRADRRNAYYTEFLPIDPDKADQDLRDVLAHGLMDEADKKQISTLLQSGRSNSEIAYWLSRAYSGEIETLNLETGDIADYRTTAQGIELEVMDAEEKRLAMLYFRWDEVAPLLCGMYARQLDGFGQEQPQSATESPAFHSETMAVYPGDKNNLPYDVVVERLHIEEPEPPAPVTEPEKTFEEVLDEHPVSIQVNSQWQTFPNAKAAEEASYEEYKANLRRNAKNFRITDEHLGEGGPKAKFQANVNAIRLLKELEAAGQQASPEQQEVLSRYVGWGGLSDAFDPEKPAWALEYAQLKELLTPEEYAAARSSTLNAHYTSPTVIQAIYEAVDRMGFETGNILEPSMGVGNFFGMLPEKMRNSRLYGVELDPVSGRIAKQLYPKADITVGGFETTDRRDFFDLAIGNVPFGQYQVNDKAYNKLNFSIHNYFFAKALGQVRPGGVVAFVTSRYTMDAKDSTVRRYLAQRAELLGAIRLPNDAFKKNAGAEVVSDIIFLQKRDRPLDIVPEWTQTGQTEDGFAINRYFIDHPEMVLGRQEPVSTAHGMDYTVNPIEGLELSDQLHDAVKYIHTKMRNVAGLSTSDAQKSSDMFAKCRYMDEITGNRGVIFATGTPVSNSMTELYTMQRYLQYERLQELNMTHFDCWASRFGETVTALELAPEGTGYRARTRFSKFFNLPELMNLFKEVADIKTADQLNLPTPEVEYHNIVAQPTEHQQEMVKALSERASLVHSGTVDPSQDNMLKITSDGRKLGLDQRIVNQMLPDEPGTKVNQCVDNIMQIWRDGKADKLTQLVFCDISTPQAKAPASKAAKTLDNPLLHALEGAVPLPEQEPVFTVYDDILSIVLQNHSGIVGLAGFLRI